MKSAAKELLYRIRNWNLHLCGQSFSLSFSLSVSRTLGYPYPVLYWRIVGRCRDEIGRLGRTPGKLSQCVLRYWNEVSNMSALPALPDSHTLDTLCEQIKEEPPIPFMSTTKLWPPLEPSRTFRYRPTARHSISHPEYKEHRGYLKHDTSITWACERQGKGICLLMFLNTHRRNM